MTCFAKHPSAACRPARAPSASPVRNIEAMPERRRIWTAVSMPLEPLAK